MIKTEITGTTFVNVKEGQYGKLYSVQLSKKGKEEEWENTYINAQFKKDAYVPDGSKIDIKSGWLSFYKTKENKPAYYLFINEFELLQAGRPSSYPASQIVKETEGLPF